MGCASSKPRPDHQSRKMRHTKYAHGKEQAWVNGATSSDTDSHDDMSPEERRYMNRLDGRQSSVGEVTSEPGTVALAVQRGWAEVKAKVSDHINSKEDELSLAAFTEESKNYKPSKKLKLLVNSWMREIHDATTPDATNPEDSIRTPSADSLHASSYGSRDDVPGSPLLSIAEVQLPGSIGSAWVEAKPSYVDCLLKNDARDTIRNSLTGSDATKSNLSSVFCQSQQSARTSVSMMSNINRGANGLSSMKLASGASIMKRSPQTKSFKKFDNFKFGNEEQKAREDTSKPSAAQATPQNVDVDDMDALLYGNANDGLAITESSSNE